MATTRITLRDAFGLPFELEVEEGPDGVLRPIQKVQVSGSSQDLRGLYASRPEANSVPPGTTYWAVDKIGEPQELSVSDGSTWRNI